MTHARSTGTARGVTLAELLIALAVGAVVIGLVSQLAVRATRSFARTEERVDARQRLARAFMAARLALVDAWFFASERDAHGVIFETAEGKGRLWWDAASGQLRLQHPGRRRATVLIERGVTAFTVAAPGQGVLTLLATLGSRRAPAVQVAYDVVVPCIAQRDRTIPWVRALEPARALLPSR